MKWSRQKLLALALLLNLIWALSLPVSKVLIDTISPLALAFWRMAGSGLLLLPFLKKSDFPKKINAIDWLWLFLMGIVGCAMATVLQYYSTQRTLASNISLIVAMETVIIVFMAAAFFKEKVTHRGLIGLALSLIGVLLITVNPESFDLVSSQYFEGNALMMISVLCYAIYTLIGKKLCDGWGTTAITAIPFSVSAVALIPANYFYDPAGFRNGLNLNFNELMGVFYIVVIATALSYLVWNWILARLPAGDLSQTLYLQPVAGFFFSLWILDEPWTFTSLMGSLLVLVGVGVSHQSAHSNANQSLKPL